jgi:hypothetical protein
LIVSSRPAVDSTAAAAAARLIAATGATERKRAPPAPSPLSSQTPLLSCCTHDTAVAGALGPTGRGSASGPSPDRSRPSPTSPTSPPGREQHDHEEDEPDQGVEALRPEHVADLRRVLARVVVDHRVDQRTDPCALEPVEAARPRR